MNKKFSRLTESDFDKIIKESVSRVLNEMDWKTYMNASRKRKQQANDMRNNLAKGLPKCMMANKRNSLDDKSDA